MLDVTTVLLRLTVGEPDPNGKEKMDPEMTLECAMTRGKNLFTLGVNYRTSPIVVDQLVPTPSTEVSSSYCVPERCIASGRPCTSTAGAPPPTGSVGQSPSHLCRHWRYLETAHDIFASMYHTSLVFVPLLSILVVRQVLSVLERLERKGSEKLARHHVVVPPSCCPTSQRSQDVKDIPAEAGQWKFSGEQ